MPTRRVQHVAPKVRTRSPVSTCPGPRILPPLLRRSKAAVAPPDGSPLPCLCLPLPPAAPASKRQRVLLPPRPFPQPWEVQEVGLAQAAPLLPAKCLPRCRLPHRAFAHAHVDGPCSTSVGLLMRCRVPGSRLGGSCRAWARLPPCSFSGLSSALSATGEGPWGHSAACQPLPAPGLYAAPCPPPQKMPNPSLPLPSLPDCRILCCAQWWRHGWSRGSRPGMPPFRLRQTPWQRVRNARWEGFHPQSSRAALPAAVPSSRC